VNIKGEKKIIKSIKGIHKRKRRGKNPDFIGPATDLNY
jgi:hypothetical protein